MDESRHRALAAAAQLIEVGRECESALATAAEVADFPAVRDRYRARAAAWSHFCAALEHAIQDLGGVPPRSPGIVGTLRRAWIKIKAGAGDDAAIAAECSRRETEALRRCAQAVEDDLRPEVRDVVEQFFQQAPAPRRS